MQFLHRVVLAYVAELGATDAAIESGGSHLRLAFDYDGKRHHLPISCSPSDQNVVWLKRRDIRRALGIRQDGMVGERRMRRQRSVVRPFAWPWSGAAIPDWRDTLRTHPLYQAIEPWQEEDAVASYYEAIRAIGDRVRGAEPMRHEGYFAR